MEPRFEHLEETHLIGTRVRMSLIQNKTAELWRQFMPRRAEISNGMDENHYSVEVYDDLSYFSQFDPGRLFDKWAAIKVKIADNIPEGLEALIIPTGPYAVFHYKGSNKDISGAYQYILQDWLPHSGYQLDDRPHFAIMGDDYKNDDPNSEEDLWIPIR